MPHALAPLTRKTFGKAAKDMVKDGMKQFPLITAGDGVFLSSQGVLTISNVTGFQVFFTSLFGAFLTLK